DTRLPMVRVGPLQGVQVVPTQAVLASLHAEPGVRRFRDAAELVGDDVWITVTIPGDFEGAEGDPVPGVDAIQQWTSVVLHPVELTWLREMLALNVASLPSSRRGARLLRTAGGGNPVVL